MYGFWLDDNAKIRPYVILAQQHEHNNNVFCRRLISAHNTSALRHSLFR